MKRIVRTLMVLVSLVCLPVVQSCNHTAGSSRIVVAALRGPSAVGMIQMIDSLAQTTDALIEVRILDEPLQVRKMMLDGSADFAVLPTTMAALLYNKGIDYQLAAVPIWGTLYLCGTGSTITDWQSLRGKKVYLMAKGMNPDILFRHLLIKNGLQPYVDVDLDYRFPTHIDLANATMAGRTGLSVISEPYLSQALNRNKSLNIIFDLGEEWEKQEQMPLPETAFICSSSVSETAYSLVMNSYRRSIEWVVAHPDKAARLCIVHGINADAKAVETSVERSHFRFVEAKDIKPVVNNYLQVFFEMDPKTTGNRLPDERFYR